MFDTAFDLDSPLHVFMAVLYLGFLLTLYPAGWHRRRAAVEAADAEKEIARRRVAARNSRVEAEVASRFRDLHPTLDDKQREQLLGRWMEKKSCSRVDAMRWAIRHRERKKAAVREKV